VEYLYPFGEKLHPLTQEDRTPKKVFVLGVYASAVHAKWVKDGKIYCRALAVASEPRIFWDGNTEEAKEIIGRIKIPEKLGRLEPADATYNGPSAKVLDENILAPLGFGRKDAWLCDCLPETRINERQENAHKKYNEFVEEYGLNPITIPKCPSSFCTEERAKEISAELMESRANLLVLLGDKPIQNYLKKVADVPYRKLSEYVNLYGYGTITQAEIEGKTINILPLAHPRQIGRLSANQRDDWAIIHAEWERKIKSEI